jgi:hypothetical protein
MFVFRHPPNRPGRLAYWGFFGGCLGFPCDGLRVGLVITTLWVPRRFPGAELDPKAEPLALAALSVE